MIKLTTRPAGGTYQERLLRHVAREKSAKRWLKYLVEVLHILLLVSIGLFMAGLLYQLRELCDAFEETLPRLLMTWRLASILSSVIFLVILAATVHALRHEVSPFGGYTSTGIHQLISYADVLLTIIADSEDKFVAKSRVWLGDGWGVCVWIPMTIFTWVGMVCLTLPLWLPALAVGLWRLEYAVDED